MTNKEFDEILERTNTVVCNREWYERAVKALEQEPYEKFESVKDHIYKLAGDYKCWDNRITHDEVLELCHILEQEPCKNAIDKEAVFAILRRHHREHGRDVDGDWVPGDYTEGVYDEIKALPPVTPTRKKGKWIYHEKSISTGFKDMRECSCCHCYFRWEMPRNSYCPNCGAEMESGE